LAQHGKEDDTCTEVGRSGLRGLEIKMMPRLYYEMCSPSPSLLPAGERDGVRGRRCCEEGTLREVINV